MKIYDVETFKLADETEGGWKNPFGMGFGSAVVYCNKDDLYTFYGPEDREKLIEDLSGNVVVAFNSLRFDNAVVLGNNWRDEPKVWLDYDIKEELTRSWLNVADTEEAEIIYGRPHVHGSMSLDKLCKMTINKGKNDSGAHAPTLINEGRWRELYQYNIQDVRLTRQLLEFMIEHGYVISGTGKRINIKVPKWVWKR